MFGKDLMVDINNLLNEDYIFYAHRNDDLTEEKETIQEHINRSTQYFMSIVNAKKLNDIFENFEDYWFPNKEKQYLQLFEELIINTIVFHDIGKVNPLFQSIQMKNPMFQKEKGNYILGSEHSIISAILYLECFLAKCMDFPKEIRKKFRLLIYINAYVISKHHGSLDRFEDFLDSFYEGNEKNRIRASIIREEYKKYFNNNVTFLDTKHCERSIKSVKKYENIDREESIHLYIYEKLIYSLLVASDYYATTEYNNRLIIESHGMIKEIQNIIDVYKSTEINQRIEEYRRSIYYKNEKELDKVNDINLLRSELYLEAEEKLLNNLDGNIFYLEAPTGSGKSNVALNLSFQLIKHCKNISKIMYIYPFNTLVEQNIKSIEKIFNDNKAILANISVVNSIYPILKDGDNNYSLEDYEKALLDRQFFNYPITLSTHVTLFDLMFGSNKESGFAFYQLANSVIVLDEIQSYKNTIWTEIISFLKVFSKMLNIKIIIMSATLPDLDILSKEHYKAVKLITNRNKYFLHPLFKDRVVLNYKLLETPNVLCELNKRIKEDLKRGKKILVEFIKKKSAIEFYKCFIEDREKYKIELITGDDNSSERERILSELDHTDEGVPFLLVATQVVEAGVDLKNIDIGYKDISKLDSEEQFLGRVNRSSRKNGVVYFFDYDNAKTIYKEDVRINDNLTLKTKIMREILKEKKFNEYYGEVLKFLRTQNESLMNDKNINEFFEQVGKLNAPLISGRMKLIDDDEWSCSVFLSRIIQLSNGTSIDGKEIWEDYKKLLRDKKEYGYAEWRLKVSVLRSKMNYFIYQINKKSLFPYTEQLGEMYYIENADQYFEGGKFIREKFETQVGTFI